MAIDLDAYFDRISKLKRAHRIIIFAATVVILAAVFIMFIYLPNTGEIANLKSQVDKLDDKIMKAKIKAEKKEKLEGELASAQSELELALKLLPSTSEIPHLLKSITGLGNESNLEFLLFSPEREVPREELYVEIPVSVQVRGTYHDVATFFDRIGKLDRIVNVVDVNIVPIKPHSTILRTSCRALTYRFQEKQKAPGAPKKKK